MAEVMTYYESFNNKLNEFLNDLHTTFPEMTDIKVLKSGLQFAKTMDVKMAQTMFDKHVAAKYEDQILKQNETFFLNETYTHIANAHGIDLDIIGRLKDVWSTMDDSNREIIWKYLKVLVLLNKKCKHC